MTCPFRTGIGWDSHRFKEGRKLVLCGVEIPSVRGLDGHSDADAPVHALIDALLGALALGDVGGFFPDTSEEFRNADSMGLLRRVMKHENFRSWKVVNADMIIKTESPRIAPHTAEMRMNIASALGIDAGDVSIKGKTAEKMDSVGRGEALEAFANVLLERI